MKGLAGYGPWRRSRHTYWNWRANHQPATLAYGLSSVVCRAPEVEWRGTSRHPAGARTFLSAATFDRPAISSMPRHSDFQRCCGQEMSALLDLPFRWTSSLWQRVRATALPAHSLRALVSFVVCLLCWRFRPRKRLSGYAASRSWSGIIMLPIKAAGIAMIYRLFHELDSVVTPFWT